MMATLFGNVQEYDSEKEEWSQYAERLEHFFLASKVEDAERKRAILLSVMGPACYRLLRSLVAPVKPSEKMYKELVDALKEHHEPMPSEIVQRCKLNIELTTCTCIMEWSFSILVLTLCFAFHVE